MAVDHVDWLGDDINVIGFEKAGIYRSGKPAICGQPKPPATVAAHADDIKAEFYQVGIQYTYEVNGDSWNWNSGAFQIDALPIPSLPLPKCGNRINGARTLNLASVMSMSLTV